MRLREARLPTLDFAQRGRSGIGAPIPGRGTMWSSRLFWKFFLAYAVLTVLASSAFVWVVAGWQGEQLIEQVDERLRTEATLLESHLRRGFVEGFNDDLRQRIDELGEKTNSRITLISPDGKVLADNREDPSNMDNHKDRPEIRQAAASKTGTSQRVSPTLELPMLYVAVASRVDGKVVGYVRVSNPLQAIHEQAADIKKLIWLVALMVSLAVLITTYWVVGRILQPVATLTAAAEAIAAGDYSRRVYVSNQDELGILATTFDHMSRELAGKMEDLRLTGERLATVLGSMIEGVVAIDADQRILFVNDAARDLLKIHSPETKGRPLLEAARSRTLHETALLALNEGEPCRSEFETVGPDRRFVAVYATRLPGDTPPGVVIVLHDITELRRLENMRQEFVANVSHELKTPLSSIKAYAETLLSGALDDPATRVNFVRRIDEQAQRLHELILDMLSLSQIESGQQGFDIVPVSLPTVIRSVISNQQPAASAKNLSLRLNETQPEVYVRADEEGLRQILVNLIDNAIKYTPTGGAVNVGYHTENGDVLVDVSDTGIGIPAEMHNRIFERFYRVDKARSRELGGTGLGLSIVKHLAQSFGGSVQVQSQVEHGSTFTITLPREVSET